MNTLERNTIVGERYLIVNLQSKDSDGEVYLAVDQASGKSVLMKRMFCYDEKQSQSLQREALALIKLEHSNLPKFIDYFSEGSARYLVSEYISGEYLSEVVENSKKPLPLGRVIFWADQLLEVLAYLHSQSPPIIHRDVKPQNLKLTKNQDIFLFGFPLSVTSQNTKSSYASLEQIRGSGVTERCDIYSLSATLYYLLTAQTPPDVTTRADQVLNQFPDPLKPLSVINPNVPKEISDLVMKGMSLSPSLRYSSAKEMQSFLREVYADVKRKQSESHLRASALPSELKTEVLTQEDVSLAESTPVEKRFETNYFFTSSMVEVDPQKQETRQNVPLTPQSKFDTKEVLQEEVSVDVGDDLQKTLILEDSPKEVKPPFVEEKFGYSQKKTEILPEQIFPEVVSAEERTESFSSQKESIFQNFPHIPEKLPQEVSSREDSSNLTVPIIKYDELLSEQKEQAFPERQKVKTVAYEKTATLVQENITQEHVSQPIAPQQPVISRPSKSKFSLIVMAVVSIFLFGSVLLVAGAYVFRNVLFSTAKPTPTPFIETTPEPTPTLTPQVFVEQTPEIIIQTSPTPSFENLNTNTANPTTFSSNTSPNEDKTETSQKRNLEKDERKPTSPTKKQSSRKTDNQPGQEPKKTPERRLEILQ